MKRTEIGKTLAKARKAQNMTQSAIQKSTGINKSTISEIENGRFTGSLDILERYVNTLGFELSLTTIEHKLPDWDELGELFDEDE